MKKSIIILLVLSMLSLSVGVVIGYGVKVRKKTVNNKIYKSEGEMKKNNNDLSVKVKKIYNGTIVLNVKNERGEVYFETPGYCLYSYKGKKWKYVHSYTPMSVPFKPFESRTLYICWGISGIDEKYLDEKKV